MAAADDDLIQDDDFKEYNPHPYQGGYDIALTYGHPLPPSPAICYPLAQPQPSPPLPPLPTPVVEQISSLPSPTPVAEQIPSLPSPTPVAEQIPSLPSPDQHPHSSPQDYINPEYISRDPGPEPYLSAPSQFWPFSTPIEEEISRRRHDSEEAGYWNQWRRASDYLFGYSQGFGERWAGVDSYGIPIYAYKRHGDQPLVVQVDPARDEKLEYYEAESEQLCYAPYGTQSDRSDEVDYHGMALCVQENQIEETWCEKQSYDGDYGEQVYPLQNWCSSYDERQDKIYSSGITEYAYDRHYHGESLSVQLEPIVTQKASYYGDYQEYTSAEANRHPSYGESLEPFEPAWSRNPSYYGVYEEEASPESKWPFSSNSAQVFGSNVYGSSNYDYGRDYHEQALTVQLEPFKPTWSENPIHYEIYKDEVSPKPCYDYGRDYHEQALIVQLEPFNPSWSENPIHYEMYTDEVSSKSHQGDDDPYKEFATQLFCPFQKFPDYGK